MVQQPSPSPTYKLFYFNVKALAEPIRMLFAYGKVRYEDIRIEKEDWPSVKSSMPMGQMPVLEVDGQRVHQSSAISRYIAKRVGLAGDNDWENLQIDVIVDSIADFRTKIAAAHYEPDEASKQKKFTDLKDEYAPFILEKLDNIAKENNGYLALGKLTWADVFFFATFDYMKFMLGFDFTQDRPYLKQVLTHVANVEAIKNWIEKRPKTDI